MKELFDPINQPKPQQKPDKDMPIQNPADRRTTWQAS